MSEKDRRKRRTSLNQYLIYLDAVEEDEMLRTGNLASGAPADYFLKKWDALSEKLNTCENGPSMTPDEWKKRLNDWKNSTRCKFRRSQNGETGIAISTLEKRALALFGSNAVSRSGFQSHNSTSTEETDHNAELESMLKEVEFIAEEEQDSLHIVKRRSREPDHYPSNTQKIIKIEKNPEIKKKTIIYDFDPAEENLDEEPLPHMMDQETPRARPRNQRRSISNNNFSPKNTELNQHGPSYDSGPYSAIAHQIKRIADVKEEKLRFEIAKYKYNNPGFKYDYHGTERVADELQDDAMLYNGENYSVS